MHSKLLVPENTVIQLMAQAAIDQFMIEWLAAYILRIFHPDSQKEWLDDLEKGLSRSVELPPATTDVQAILLSDVAVEIRDRGRQLVDRLREHTKSDRLVDRGG